MDTSRSSAELTRIQFGSQSFTWVLEVGWFVPLRWATDPLVVIDSEGEEVSMRGGLEVGLNEAVSFFGETEPEREVTVRGLRAAAHLNMALLVEQGYQFAGSEAILSMWAEGIPWEARRVVLRGIVREPTLGGPSEPLAFSVRAIRRTDLPKQPLPSERCSVVTWPYEDNQDLATLPEISDGNYYPIVYGKPGFREKRPRRVFSPNVPFDFRPNTFNQGGGSPASIVHADYDLTEVQDETPGENAIILALILNGFAYEQLGTLKLPGENNAVSILNVTKDERQDGVPIRISGASLGLVFDVNTPMAVDGLGQQTTLVELTAFYIRSNDPWVVGDELWVLWDESQGATPSDRSTGILRTAGEVVEHALRTGGSVVDTAGWAGLEEELAGYQIDTYRNKPVDAWEWVSSEILPLVPVGIVDSRAGLAPILWRWDVDENDALGHIQTGMLGIERKGQVSESNDWTNAIRVNYRPKTAGKDFDRIAAVVGETLVSDSQHPTTQSLASTSRYGEREAKVVDAVAVQDTATAHLIAAWMAAVFASPWREVELRDKQRSWAHIPVGGVVLFSDTELGWSRRICWLIKRVWDDTHPTMTLLWIPDPVRD